MSKATAGDRRGVARVWVACLAVSWLAVVGSAGLLAWWLGTSLGGPVAGAGAALGVLLVPLGFAMAVERVAQARKKELRAERLLVPTMLLASLGAVGAATWIVPEFVGEHLRALDDSGFVADQGRKVGRLWLRLEPAKRPAGSGEVTSSALPASLPTGATPTTLSPLPDTAGAPQEPTPSSAVPSADRSVGDKDYREDGSCDPLADVSAIEQSYDAGAFRASAEALTRARYPLGLPFLEAQDDTALRTWFVQGVDGFDDVVAGLEAAVHEGSHIWGAKRLNGRTATYRVAPGSDVQVRWLRNFHRSEILARHKDANSDSYRETYLSGSSGAQGFNTLLDEYNAYAHSLAVRWCTRDLLPRNQRVSARDGMLTMMYYVELYLLVARSDHPKDYAAILADEGHRRLVTLVWDRAEYLLRKTAAFPELGLQDERIQDWVYAPELVGEVQRLREFEGAGPRGR